MSVTISVCIANYNGAAMLHDCIDSVLAQRVDAAVEIIVHDDASTDASLELLRTGYPQVRVLASEQNVGFCIANNRMAEVAAGDYLLLLNNDAALAPDALATLLASSSGLPARASSPFPSTTGKVVHWWTVAACWIRSTTRCPIWIRHVTTLPT